MVYAAKSQPGETDVPPTPISAVRRGGLRVPGEWASRAAPRAPGCLARATDAFLPRSRQLQGRSSHIAPSPSCFRKSSLEHAAPLILSQMHSTLITCNSCRNLYSGGNDQSLPLWYPVSVSMPNRPLTVQNQSKMKQGCRTSPSFKYCSSTRLQLNPIPTRFLPGLLARKLSLFSRSFHSHFDGANEPPASACREAAQRIPRKTRVCRASGNNVQIPAHTR